MDDRRTLRSGLPAALSRELDALVSSLVPCGPSARHRVERVLGRGALFVTFRSTRIDESGAVPRALKVLRPSLARAWPGEARLLTADQAKVLAILNERLPPSPHVVRLVELGELAEDPARGVDVSVPWIALELVEDNLFDVVRRAVTRTGVALDPIFALRVLEGVARGLDWIHQHGLLHRGLSPWNVMVHDRGARAIAKVSDVAVARPRGLPSTFGLSEAALPYLAPEQRDPHAELDPSCDVHAFAGLVRFVVTGRAPSKVPLEDEPTLHPAFARRSHELQAIDRIVAQGQSAIAEERPPTAWSFWQLLAEPLGDLSRAPRVAMRPRRASAPPDVGTWVWTERHRPEAARSLRRIAVSSEGHALAIDRGGLGYFDGSRWRTPACDVVAPTFVARGDGRFVVGGRGRDGRARVVALDVDGNHPILEAGGEIVAACDDRDAGPLVVEARGGALWLRTPFGAVAVEGASSVSSIVRIDDRAFLLVGEASIGGPYLASFETGARSLRPQPASFRGRVLALDADGSGDVWLGGAHGTAVVARRVLESIARLASTREQVPTTDDVTAMAIGPDGAPWCAAGRAVYRRGGSFVPIFRDDAPGPPFVALVPRPRGLLAFDESGHVLEGRSIAIGADDNDAAG